MEGETERRTDPAGSGRTVCDRAYGETGAGSDEYRVYIGFSRIPVGLHERSRVRERGSGEADHGTLRRSDRGESFGGY